LFLYTSADMGYNLGLHKHLFLNRLEPLQFEDVDRSK
jgi:hypothetical protein